MLSNTMDSVLRKYLNLCQLCALCLFCFAVVASKETAFVGHPSYLACDVAGSTTADWMYQRSEDSRRQRISVNGSTSSDTGRYTVDGSSLIINEVKASDAGIYTCGHGDLLYHKLWLTVIGLLAFRCFYCSGLIAGHSRHEKGFRPSVHLSNMWIVTKREKDLSRFLYHTKDHLA